MYKYIAKRLLFLIPTILGVTFIIFAVMNITPGDPGRAILGVNASQADVDAYNHELGYDKPFLEKYVNYLEKMIFHGDFGTSYYTKQSVFDEIWPRYTLTIRMSLIAIILSSLIGIPIGIYAAVKQYSLWDTIPSLLQWPFPLLHRICVLRSHLCWKQFGRTMCELLERKAHLSGR